MGMFMWFKIAKNKKINEAILEIAANKRSPFSPNLVDFSAYVPPALQNGFMNVFVLGNFESHKHLHNKFWSQNSLIFFSLWATLANLGGWALFLCFENSTHLYLILFHSLIICENHLYPFFAAAAFLWLSLMFKSSPKKRLNKFFNKYVNDLPNAHEPNI